MTRLIATAAALFAVIVLAACENAPGADGRYATHDRGYNNRV